MQKLTTRHAVQVHFDAMRFLCIQLAVYPDLKEMLDEATALIEELKSAEGAYQQSKFYRMSDTAKITYLDKMLGKVVSKIARAVRVLVDGNLKSPVYVTLFTKAPSTAMRGGVSEDQKRFISNIIYQVENNDVYDSLRPELPALKAQNEALLAAVASREAKQDAESRALTARNLATEHIRAFYNLLPSRLNIHFQGQEALVDSFFYAVPKTRNAKKDEGGSEEE